jgi:hypothetical protein
MRRNSIFTVHKIRRFLWGGYPATSAQYIHFFLNKKVIVTVCKSDQHYSRFLLDIEDMKSFFFQKTEDTFS